MAGTVFPTAMLVLFVIALLFTIIGFKNYVWFMSVGYGLAIMVLGCGELVYSFMGPCSMWFRVLCLVLIVYGARLGLFLLLREMKSASFRNSESGKSIQKEVPVFVKVAMWIFCSLLYVCQVSPLTYRMVNGNQGNTVLAIGTLLAAAGVVIETIADQQKSEAKKINPGRYCDTGLYKYCRCPNYFGEIVVWTGVFVTAFGNVTGAQWIIVLIGFIGIVYVMYEGAVRLEKRHNRNYGNDPGYKEYSNTTPILIPFIPIYHLVKEGK